MNDSSVHTCNTFPLISEHEIRYPGTPTDLATGIKFFRLGTAAADRQTLGSYYQNGFDSLISENVIAQPVNLSM